MGRTLSVGLYSFRATFRRRWGGYLAIVLLIGLLGGLAMGSIAAARRTESSFPVYWASTHPSDLVGLTGILNPGLGSGAGYDASLVRAIAHLPHISNVESQVGIDFLPLQRDGRPLNAPNFDPPAAGNGYGSLGMYFDQDRVKVTDGRMADPDRPNELMLSVQAASALGVRVGDVLPIGIYTNAQTQLPGFGTARVKPMRIIDEHVVGIAEFSTSVVEDQVDDSNQPNNLFTPALTRQLLQCCVNYSESGVQVEGGARNVTAVAGEIAHILPKGFPPFGDQTTGILAKAHRSIEPEAIAVGVFGGIVALAALLIAAQLIGRQLRLDVEEREVLRSLGAGPAITSTVGLIGVVGSVLVGALLAAAVGVVLSPLAPLGPVRPVYPDGGISFDWTVLGLGVVVLVVALSAIAAAIGFRGAPHRRGNLASGLEHPSRMAGAGGALGLSTPAQTGIRFALEPGSGRRSVPVRSAIFGTAMALVVLVGTVTFGTSLDSLVSHPALYGWNWNYMLVSGGDIPQHQATVLLDHDRDIAQWSAIYTPPDVEIDDQSVPVLSENPGATVAPPILSGHGLQSTHQVVLGAVTLAQLHKRVGETVTVSNGLARPTRLQIVGTATMPTIGSTEGAHLEMGTGAVLASQLISAADRNPFNDPLAGPNDVFVRLRQGPSRSVELRSLQRIAKATSNNANFGVVVVGVLRPAEIVNYRSLGATPLYLGTGLALGAVAALGLTLVASVRRRRRDLALLKTLGFTGRQLAATIAWQSTIAVVIGTVVGVPLGIALGRWLWDLFARNIHAVPSPTVPALLVALVALGAIALANVVAFLPGRIAASTPTALLLRSE